MLAVNVILAALASTALAAPAYRKETPNHYAEGYLEPYATYHARYIALECYKQHDTEFFSDCCSPILASETLADVRKPYCIPNATQSASADEYTSTASATASEDLDAVSAYHYATSTGSASAEATTTAVAEAQVQKADVKTSSTSEWVAPSTTSTSEAPAQTSEASSGNSPSGDVKTGGYATFFYQNGNAGACGTVHSDSDKIIAIDGNGYWQDFSQASPYCGKWINIKNTQNGKTVTAMVADVCPTCVSDNSLDLSTGAFNAIASPDEGSVPIEWSWA